LLLFLVTQKSPVAVFFFLAGQARHDAIDAHVQFGRFVGRAGNDQRRARFVDQDRVDFVDDGEFSPRWKRSSWTTPCCREVIEAVSLLVP
jgi:hypothetical protein